MRKVSIFAAIFFILSGCTSPISQSDSPTSTATDFPATSEPTETNLPPTSDPSLQDTDNDGITDFWSNGMKKDKCDDTISGCEVYPEDYIEQGVTGCYKFACDAQCKVAGGQATGENLKLNIIIVPCGFDNELHFETLALYAADTLMQTSPFLENQENYRVSYIWSTAKKNADALADDSSVFDLCYRPTGNQAELDQVAKNTGSKCSENENAIYIELINHDPGFGSYNGIMADEYLQINYDSFNTRLVHLFATDKFFNENLLHELGHAFKFANQQDYIFTKYEEIPTYYNSINHPSAEVWNDDFIPDYPGMQNVPTDLCPIWSGILAISGSDGCGGSRGIKMGCWTAYDGYAYKYSLCDGDIMSLQRNREPFYTPVQEFMIGEALRDGYDTYLGYLYPHRCREIGMPGVRKIGNTDRDNCLVTECSRINPHHDKKQEYINRLVQDPDSEDAKSNMYACCSQIYSNELKSYCRSFDVLNN